MGLFVYFIRSAVILAAAYCSSKGYNFAALGKEAGFQAPSLPATVSDVPFSLAGVSNVIPFSLKEGLATFEKNLRNAVAQTRNLLDESADQAVEAFQSASNQIIAERSPALLEGQLDDLLKNISYQLQALTIQSTALIKNLIENVASIVSPNANGLTDIFNLQTISGPFRSLKEAGEKAAVTGEKAAVTGEKAAVTGEKAAVTGEKAAVTGEKAAVTGEKAAVTGEKAAVTDEQATLTDEQATLTDEQVTLTDEQVTLTDEQVTLTDEQVTLTDEQVTLTDEQVTEASIAKPLMSFIEQFEDLSLILKNFTENLLSNVTTFVDSTSSGLTSAQANQTVVPYIPALNITGNPMCADVTGAYGELSISAFMQELTKYLNTASKSLEDILMTNTAGGGTSKGRRLNDETIIVQNLGGATGMYERFQASFTKIYDSLRQSLQTVVSLSTNEAVPEGAIGAPPTTFGATNLRKMMLQWNKMLGEISVAANNAIAKTSQLLLHRAPVSHPNPLSPSMFPSFAVTSRRLQRHDTTATNGLGAEILKLADTIVKRTAGKDGGIISVADALDRQSKSFLLNNPDVLLDLNDDILKVVQNEVKQLADMPSNINNGFVKAVQDELSKLASTPSTIMAQKPSHNKGQSNFPTAVANAFYYPAILDLNEDIVKAVQNEVKQLADVPSHINNDVVKAVQYELSKLPNTPSSITAAALGYQSNFSTTVSNAVASFNDSLRNMHKNALCLSLAMNQGNQMPVSFSVEKPTNSSTSFGTSAPSRSAAHYVNQFIRGS